MAESPPRRKLRQREEAEAGKEDTKGEETRASKRIKGKDVEKKIPKVEVSKNPFGASVDVENKAKQYDFELDEDLVALKAELRPKLNVSAGKVTDPAKELKTDAMDVDESTNEPEVLGERTASPPAEQKWTKGEKILCFHGPLIYEAKIQEVELQNSIPKYFIHYKGWNKNWDEWVPEARMLKFTEKNAENQASLVQAHEAREASRKRREHVFAVPKTPSPVPKKEQGRRKSGGLKPKRREATGRGDEFLLQNGKAVNLKAPDGTVETEEQFRTKVEIKIKMPEELKSYIVDDWAQVCRRRKVCVLPARTTADQLITEYARVKTVNKAEKLKNNKEKAIIEVTAGVREYFNVMLSSQLLYRQERQQYEQLRKQEPGLVPCKVYGPVHLLRLFTRLGEMLVYTPLSEKSIQLLLFYVHDLLAYIKRNASVIFSLADYQDAV